MDEMTFSKQMKEEIAAVETVLSAYLPKEEGYQHTVIEAMNYSVLAGGKRLRPMMLSLTDRMFGGCTDLAEPFMAAIEMIHTYSLVHDDLPAMDNDAYRRGRETTWKVYGDGMGVLAGDGLLNYAFETAMRAFPVCAEGDLIDPAYPKVAAALSVLARKAGIYGMIGGQCADIEDEEKADISSEELLFIHEHKTAALIQASLMIGGILAGATSEQVEALERCAYYVGIAFQIQDDILDVEGDSAELGKNVGSDVANHKQTYVTIHGVERARADVVRMTGEATSCLAEAFGEDSAHTPSEIAARDFLQELLLHLIHRRK